MTQPGAVRVTVARVCAQCNGSRRIPLVGLELCRYCDGTGVVWEPVTCASCRHWEEQSVCRLFTRVGWVEADQERETPLRPWCTCDDLDIPKQNQIVYTDETFACASWEPREPRS